MKNDKSNDFYSFLTEAGGAPEKRVMECLGDGYYQLEVTEAQKRQAEDDIQTVEDGLRELLRNARDGKATKVFVATKKIGSTRVITVIDNGQGIPEKYHELVFEPHVTSRLDTAHMDYWGFHGRGMALYSIKTRFDICKLIHSLPEKGTRIRLEVNTKHLPESSEQSVKPEVKFKNGEYVVTGPHNLFRLATEFAIYEKDAIQVYLGSPAEVAATLLEDSDFKNTCKSANHLKKWANAFGLFLSARTAARVQAKEIMPLKPLLSLQKQSEKSQKELNLNKDVSKLSVSRNQKEELLAKIRPHITDFLAEYYLRVAQEPTFSIKKNKLVISYDIERDWD